MGCWGIARKNCEKVSSMPIKNKDLYHAWLRECEGPDYSTRTDPFFESLNPYIRKKKKRE